MLNIGNFIFLTFLVAYCAGRRGFVVFGWHINVFVFGNASISVAKADGTTTEER